MGRKIAGIGKHRILEARPRVQNDLPYLHPSSIAVRRFLGGESGRGGKE